jgi:hypothetical protein
MEARLSEEKIQNLDSLLLSFQGRRKCTKRDLLSLVGSLSFACKVVVPGRSFLSRLISRAYSVSDLHHHIRISSNMKKDMAIWRAFIARWNGKSMFLSKEAIVEDGSEFGTDAAGSRGYGGHFQEKWFQGEWSPEQSKWSIAAKELYPIVVAAQVWGHLWEGRRLVVNCDNAPTVGAINRGYSNKVVMGNMLRILMYFSMHNNFFLRARHVPGKLNTLADLLSRFQVRKFHQLAPLANSLPTPIEADPLDICEGLFNNYLL